MSYHQLTIHIVFATKKRKPVLLKRNRERLFQFMTAVIKNHNCFLYRINGVEDHIHVLLDLHPSISLADLIKDLKLASSKFIKENNLFSGFDYWATGYYAASCSDSHKINTINYIKNQEEHHKCSTGKEELICLLEEREIKYDMKYVE